MKRLSVTAKRVLLSMCAAGLSVGAHAAEDCHLQQLASLPISVLPSGDMAVPVTVAGTERNFEIGLSAPYSAIWGSLADEKGLPPADTSREFKASLGSEIIRTRVKVTDFSVGPMHGSNFPMLRFEQNLQNGPTFGGVIGLDMLSGFDVELDVRHKKLNLFSQKHCAGNVVYWASSYATVPLVMDPLHHFSLQMKLDGQTLLVDLDAAEGSAWMGTNSAFRYFGLDASTLKPNPQPVTGPVTYTYPFKSLTLGDITINNPKIEIFPNGKNTDCDPDTRRTNKTLIHCFGIVDVRLRGSELQQLRLYIAFAEKTLYLTPADAKPPTVEPPK